MKAFLRACALALPATAAAQSWQPVDALRAAAEQVAREQSAAPGQTLGVNAAVDPNLRVPACAAPPSARLHDQTARAVTVALSCAAPSAWTLYVVVQVAREAEVLVLNRPLAPGEAVTADAFSLRRRDVGDLVTGYLAQPELALGRIARRALTAGSALSPQDLAAPRLVRRGDSVTLVGRAGALVVRTSGKALADGASGEVIPVQNLQSRRVVRGRVRSGQEIDVDL